MRVTGFKQLAVQIGCDGGVTVAVDVRVAYEIDQIMCSSLSVHNRSFLFEGFSFHMHVAGVCLGEDSDRDSD